MEITILGSGKMTLTKKRGASAYLVKIDKNYLLLDCGHGTFKKLIDLNFDFSKLKYIYISHSHTDHIADLMPIIHSQWIEKRKKPLYLIGPKDIKKNFKKLRKVMWPEPKENPDFLEFLPAQNSIFKISSFKLITLSIQHTPLLPYKIFPALMVKLINNRKSLVYSGDWFSGAVNQMVINFLKTADLLIADASKPIGQKFGGHLNPTEVGYLAEKSKVKKVILSHLSDNNFRKLTAECKKYYSGKILVAKDFMKIKI